MTLTRQEIENIKDRLGTKRWNGGSRYRDAFRQGIADAKSVLDKCELTSFEYAIDQLRNMRHKSPYLPGNKSHAYKTAILSAMSMLSSLKKERVAKS